ncbi:amidohydrolase family protein [Sinomonas humi]|uniref:amidohydrolase family protein n=1 Tax=Sinomonas humi TaxID=1338436 RepID=UPI000691A352|nr:amidohydrolase family protein [Sinomonas humi]
MSKPAPESVLITAAQVITSFDPPGVLPNSAVGVRNGRIDWVGNRHEASPEKYQQHLDVGGTIMPGLIDAHVHLAFDSQEADPVAHAVSISPEALNGTIADNAARFLRSGVTTVRDLGSPPGTVLEFGRSVQNGFAAGPTVIASDHPLTRPRGHLWAFGGQVDTVRGADSAVSHLAAAGAKVIKVMVTGGRMTAGTSPVAVEFRPDLLSAVVARAHAEGLSVAAHSLCAEGVRAAVAAGVDTIEHGTFIEADGTPSPEARAMELARQIADAGTFVCPTLHDAHPHPISFEQRGQWVRTLWEQGARIILGNDTGIPGLPPEQYWGGIHALEMAGMSREAVLHAATGMPALAMGISAEVGGLAVGMRADLLVVDGNPIADLRHLQRPTLVMARGLITSPQSQSEEDPWQASPSSRR